MSNTTIDRFSIYSSNLTQLFDKINKNISKKSPFYNELQKFCKDLPEYLKSDKQKEKENGLNADKYFIYMKKALEIDNLKIIEAFLEYMQVLIKNELLNGRSEYIRSNSQNPDSPSKYSLYKKCLVDNIVDSIIKIFNTNDENIWLNIVKLLYTMFKNQNVEIHNDSLLKIFRICIRIYLTSRTTVNIDTTKSCLSYMIMFLFTKMENLNSGIFEREHTLVKTNSLGLDTLVMGSDEKSNRSIIGDTSMMNSIGGMSTIGGNSNTGNQNAFKFFIQKSPVEDLVSRILKNATDMVCIYDTKSFSYNNEVNNQTLINSDYVFPAVSDIIPLSTAPPNSDFFSDKRYRHCFPVMIYNEKNELSGLFGWCFNCRRQADFYCKDTRVPVCSYECKKKIFSLDEKANKYLNGEVNINDEIASLYFYDSINIFKSLCKLINTSISSSNETFNTKSKLLSLELVLLIFDKPGFYFLSNPEFIRIVKEELMEGLLKNCVSDDINLFTISLTVFNKLWMHFREFLKQQISVFIEKVFLKILDSGNSSYQHKWYVLDYFYKLTLSTKFYLELHVNYDCDLNEKDLLNRLVNILSRIAQGKGIKNDKSLLPDQEYNLKMKSIETVTSMLRYVLNFMIENGVNYHNRFLSGGEGYMPNVKDQDETVFDNPLEDHSIMDVNSTVVVENMRARLEQNQKHKFDIASAVEKFNMKPKSGVNYLKKNGLVTKENEVSGITDFLKSGYGLKKDMIGDYLGENNDLCIKVLHYYTFSFNFTGLQIVEGMRLYLSGFQLPGEAQKIDRIMQKFAAKYYEDNPNSFTHADCAYYLSFIIMMVQTDIHNPNVKNKRGIEGFIEMVKGIESIKDLERVFLEEIYNQILKKPLTLIEHEEAKDKLDTTKTKQDLYKRESERMYMEGTQQLKQGGEKLYFIINNETEQIGPLMATLWTALLAMYSIIMEETNDIVIVRKCVEGFACSIKLCGMTGLELQKEALFKGFSKHTNLLNGKEIKEKNIL